MKRMAVIHTSYAALASLMFCACGVTPQVSERMEKIPMVTAFINAQVLTMANGPVFERSTVLVKGDQIVRVGPAGSVDLPPEARRIDCAGKFIVPGLCDMHVHIADAVDLRMLLSSGVTTVRNMAEYPLLPRCMGFPTVIGLREKVGAGKLPGPRIFTSGDVLDGKPPVSPFNAVVTSPAEARRAVSRQATAGADFIKVYDRLNASTFSAIVDAAGERGIPFAGHAPKSVDPGDFLRSGVRSVEHLSAYIDNDRAAFRIDPDSLPGYAELTVKHRVFNCPTLVVWDNLPPADRYDSVRTHPLFGSRPWQIKWLWSQTLKQVYKLEYTGKDYPGLMRRLSVTAVDALHKAGAMLLVGTDMNFVNVYPGESFHREMGLLRDAGLSAYDILQAATVNAGTCLDERIGLIKEGYRADVLLLNANPLESPGALGSPDGVMAQGRWYDREKLAEMAPRR